MNPPPQIVGVVTIDDLTNFGNRLQNWAVHKALHDRGCSPVNLVYPGKNRLRKSLRSRIGYLARLHWVHPRRHPGILRARRFRSFSLLMPTRVIHAALELRAAERDCVCAVVGSDQIWNPHFFKPHPFQFLSWTADWRRIALSPSFGVSEIPAIHARLYTQMLAGFPRLSVRENAGADIIEELTGRQAEILIDPTLSISAREWRAVAGSSLRPHTSYVLTYFLGALSPERRTYIEDVASQRDAEVVNLLDPNDPHIYQAGPAEFLDFIDNAECVFTDSFHGSAFSLIFSTPLVIFERESNLASMSSRIETFVQTFGLQRCLFQPQMDVDPLAVDYTDAHEVLRQKRQQYFTYLDEELARVRNHQLRAQ